VQNDKKTFCFVTNLSLIKEPTVKNRLLPYIEQVIENGSKVILYSSDSETFDDFNSDSFTHIIHPAVEKKPSSFFRRTVFEWTMTRRLLKRVNKIDTDILVLTIPSMFLLFNSYILKNKNIFLDVRDLTWEYLSSRSPIEALAKLSFRILANRSFKFFNSIIVSNEKEADFFKKKSIYPLIYFNGVTYNQFKELSTLSKKNSSKFTVTYVGKIGLAQNLKTLVYAAEIIKDIKFNIIGYGSELNLLKKIALSKGLDNVVFFEYASWEEILNFYQESDVLYAQLKESFSGAMPSKLYQYLCARRFIIYGGMGQAKKTLSHFSKNIVIPPDDVNSLVKEIRKVRFMHFEKSNFDKNLEIIKKNYIRENNVRKILKSWFKD